jgi:CubicO group peptidase (beta-lactamase class C family)
MNWPLKRTSPGLRWASGPTGRRSWPHGVLNAAKQVPVPTDSVFQVGSITKIWTATMIMQLVDEGLLSLDTTVSEVLPGARLGAADVGGEVTVLHLLTHTSGIDRRDP